MSDSYKIATLNINGMTTQPRIAMLEDFLYKQQIDIIFLQEVTRPVFDDIRGFVTHTNIGTSGRGTAILKRNHMQLTNIVCLPTGRGMAAVLKSVSLVNIYAPPGAARRRERELFFSSELPYLLRDIPMSLLLGGDFNCVLNNRDATGHPNHSRPLQELIRGFDLVDMCEAPPGRDIYTHYTSRGASWIDRIYASRDLSGRKRGMDTRVAAFNDYLTVVLRIAFSVTTMRRGRGYWRMNMALLREEVFWRQLRQR
jgi:exonuclease III